MPSRLELATLAIIRTFFVGARILAHELVDQAPAEAFVYYLIFQCLAQQGKGEARRAPLGYGYTVGCRLLAVQMICITSSLPPGKIDYSGCEQWAF